MVDTLEGAFIPSRRMVSVDTRGGPALHTPSGIRTRDLRPEKPTKLTAVLSGQIPAVRIFRRAQSRISNTVWFLCSDISLNMSL